MRADGDAAVDGEAHGLADRRRVAAVEAAGDVGRGDEGHHAGVVAHLPGAVALAHVAVEVDALHVNVRTPTRWSAGPRRASASRPAAARAPCRGCTARSVA